MSDSDLAFLRSYYSCCWERHHPAFAPIEPELELSSAAVVSASDAKRLSAWDLLSFWPTSGLPMIHKLACFVKQERFSYRSGFGRVAA